MVIVVMQALFTHHLFLIIQIRLYHQRKKVYLYFGLNIEFSIFKIIFYHRFLPFESLYSYFCKRTKIEH